MSHLEKAKRDALELLIDVPNGADVSIAGLNEPELWLGVGYCVGKGWAVYRGGYTVKITDAGRAELQQEPKPDPMGSFGGEYF